MVRKITLGPGRVAWESRIKPADEIEAIHVVQYMTASERKRFVNACHKALKKGGKLVVIAPSWSAQRAYADIDVQWPPVAEGWFQYLNKAWREAQPVKPKGYVCDFDFTLGYSMHPAIQTRNQEYQQHAISFWKEASQDIYATLTKR